MQHAGIEYSPVPSLNPSRPPSSSNTPVPGGSDHSRDLPMFKHGFVQPGSQISLPPQMGTSSGNESIIQQQPVAEQRAPQLQNNAIIQFFLHHDVMHSKLTVHLQCASNLPREHD